MHRQRSRTPQPRRERRNAGISTAGALGLLLLGAVATFAALGLLTNIFERRQESLQPYTQVVEITEETADPAIWGQNFPHHYDQYLKTVDSRRTTFGGSEAIPREPTPEDPRSATSRSKLDRIPQLRRMWAGYAFSQDYREKRGHAFMLEDQIFTERQRVVQQPGTCLNCHASTQPAMRKLGDGDLVKGFEALNQMTYQESVEHVDGPIACIDCHEPGSMKLRITRPAFMEGIASYKASQGVADYDVNRDASRQEMRSYVCAQCHVEYYFGGEEKRLIFPWHKGLGAEDALAYFDEIGFRDWVHAETGAPMLKAQHPEFETWSQGIHARSGVSCADCHMPYARVGARKVSDHRVQSPMLNVNNACGSCHGFSDAEMQARVEEIQGRHKALTEVALDALVELIDDIKLAREAGASDEQLADALQWQRRASFLVDWVDAENSTGFHAPQESARILGQSIDASRKGQRAVAELRAGSQAAGRQQAAGSELAAASGEGGVPGGM